MQLQSLKTPNGGRMDSMTGLAANCHDAHTDATL